MSTSKNGFLGRIAYRLLHIDADCYMMLVFGFSVWYGVFNAQFERRFYMNTKTKTVSQRCLSFLLAFLMVVTIIPLSSYKAEAATGYALCWPVAQTSAKIGKVTSSFGPRKSPTAGASKNHRGVDIGVKTGTTVYAAADGVVTSVGYSSVRGNYIIVYHESLGLSTLYQHLSSCLVGKNAKVLGGGVIAKSGSTGVGTGPHLHFGVMKGKATKPDYDQPSYNKAINPLSSDITYHYYNQEPVKYSLSVQDPTDVTNNSAMIRGTLNTTAVVQKWSYYLGTDYNEVKNIDAVNNPTQTHKDTSTMDCVNAYDWSSSPREDKSFRINVTKMLGQDLKPDTSYYYKICVKIGGRWYQSDVTSFHTGSVEPGQTVLKISGNSSDIGIGDTATVTWSAANNASAYDLRLYNSSNAVVYTKTDVQGTSFTFPSECFKTAGVYTAELTAKNSAGSKKASGTPTVTVHNNVQVTFRDPISNKAIQMQSVTYGHAASAPKTPLQTGYTFIKWDKAYTNVTTDLIVNAVYEANVYTVNFTDGLTGKVLKTQRVKYGSAAVAPTVTAPTGYTFTGWDTDFTKIAGDTTVTANYQWYNTDYPIVTTINSVVRNTSKNGYDVSVAVKNGRSDITEGRIVVALKTKAGFQPITTESSAFSLSADEQKTIQVFVPYDDLAYQVAVFTVNNYEQSGPVATPVYKNIDNSSNWTPWAAYSGTVPVVKGANGVSAVETKTETTPAVTQYRFRTKSTTTSYETSLAGWTQDGGTWVNQGQQTLYYTPSWPAGFDKSHPLYARYNITPQSAWETNTEKMVIDTDFVNDYIYWHWCRGGNYGAINRSIAWNKTSTYNTFHAFETTCRKDYNSSANAFYWKDTSECTDTYWWNGLQSHQDGLIQIRTQRYTLYKKQFNYYKWSDWSAWSTTPQTATETKEVETNLVPGTTTNYYRYKTDAEVAEPTISNAQIVNLSGKVDAKFAGKEVTVFVHKYTQPSDYTNEFIGSTTVGADGTIAINGARLREAPSIETGDFTITASIAGNTGTVDIGTIAAPKPQYTVKFYDFDGTTLIAEQTVTQGETVTAPSADKLNTPVGYRFTHWNQSTVNVQSDLIVTPECERETFVVVFVDWGSHEVTLKELAYGDQIIAPAAADPGEGKSVSWDMRGATAIEETLGDGTKNTKYIVTQNTVVTTVYTENEYEANFIKPSDDTVLGDITADTDLSQVEIITDEQNTFGDRVDTPTEIEESPDYIFYGWKNIETGEYLTDTSVSENATYYPVYEFAKTVELPNADVTTGEYTAVQTVTLSCATPDAVIYYTVDGTDPETSETAIEYTAPITLSKSCTLQFCAMAMGMNNSGTVSELYAINTASSGAAYHLVTVYTDLPQQEGTLYQALIKDSTLFKDTVLQNIEGYIYNGLFVDEACTEAFLVSVEPITEQTTLYASYTPKQYTVRFFDDTHTILSTQSVAYGDSAQIPDAPIKNGYVFVGWSPEAPDYITQDMDFTARYVAESAYATVSLNRSNLTVLENTAFPLKATVTPQALSDTVLSWNTDNAQVATVDHNGVVTAVGVGKATITVTVDATGENAVCTVTVLPNSDVKITLIRNSYLKVDANGYLRQIPDKANSVAELREQFTNENLVFTDMNGTVLSDTDAVGTGTVILLKDGETVLDQMTVIMTGDYDGDGNITNRDSAMLSQYLVDKREADLYQMLAIDVNGDGNVNVRDNAMLSRYLVGKETIV